MIFFLVDQPKDISKTISQYFHSEIIHMIFNNAISDHLMGNNKEKSQNSTFGLNLDYTNLLSNPEGNIFWK